MTMFLLHGEVFPIGTASESTLAAWLHGVGGPRLERVLAVRPDAAAAPEPRSVGELADRLQRPASVTLALPGLTLPDLQVAEAVAALTPTPLAVLAGILDATDGERARSLAAVLEALADRALVWPGGDGLLHMAGPLRRAWDSPLELDAPLERLLVDAGSDELGRMVATLGLKPAGGRKQQRLAALVGHHSDPAQVASLVAKAPAATRKLLEQRAVQAPGRPDFTLFGSARGDGEPGERWALERGLLVRDRRWYGPARMPAEVALALRGFGWRAPFTAVPPVLRSAPVTASEIDREASAAAMAFAVHAAAVLAACAASPPARLKAGGIGARELSRIGRAAKCEEIVVRLALETANAAGLLARDGDRVAATEAYDTWAAEEPADRLAVLLRAWWTLPLTPGGSRDEDGKTLPALAGTPPCAGCVQARHGLLAAPTQLPVGEGATDPAELGALIAWHRPLADELPQDVTPFATLIRESELLGVLALGALSPIGDALLAEDAEAVASVCRQLLPAATGTARFGSDLTAVVAGTPSASLCTLLDSVAERESAGSASVWRFSPGSVRRALDAGHTPDAMAADLAAVAVEPLPQPLSYLLHDTARSHGRVRIVSAACVIHGEEPGLLAELAAHRRLAPLGLRQLAPTVLVSRTPPDETLAALRSAGYAPVAEQPDGSVRIERAPRHRVAGPVPPPRLPRGKSRPPQTDPRTRRTLTAAGRSALAARLRAAPQDIPEPDPYDERPYDSDTEEIIAGYARNLSFTDVRQLAHAVNEGQPVTIEYVATSGSETVRTLSRLDLDAPYLNAWCHLRDDERMFTLSRIHGVTPA
ncbi:helicase C-terminal domain-containing protein [Kitasatospora sp. NBC_00085]|uniref:helicase C-terminal domain-containing protein n=1 Tax=unclassified Kitasatospora TaxID=2633591 RepID=UPI002F91B85D